MNGIEQLIDLLDDKYSELKIEMTGPSKYRPEYHYIIIRSNKAIMVEWSKKTKFLVGWRFDGNLREFQKAEEAYNYVVELLNENKD